jgi:hypothetical protein
VQANPFPVFNGFEVLDDSKYDAFTNWGELHLRCIYLI